MGRKRKPVINDNIEREAIRLTKYYQMLALNRYKWENLPKGIESRYIEQMLFDNGECALFDHPEFQRLEHSDQTFHSSVHTLIDAV